jgi:hypothetical protein
MIRQKTCVIIAANLVAAIATVAASSAANAAKLPERFKGVWQLIEQGSATCRASDWQSERHNDALSKIEGALIHHHESECRFTTVTLPKRGFDSGAVHIVMTCEGEGERWKRTEIWQTVSVKGENLLAMTDTSRQMPSTGLYQKCLDDAAGTGKAGGGEQTAAGDTAGARSGKTNDLRAKLTPGRHCFVSKANGADFYLDIDKTGSASFSIDVVNHNTKHLCAAGGTAKPIDHGWRYTDTSRPGQSCRLDIEVTDRIRFRLDDDACERRYCGARASIVSVEFSERDRMKSCPSR